MTRFWVTRTSLTHGWQGDESRWNTQPCTEALLDLEIQQSNRAAMLAGSLDGRDFGEQWYIEVETIAELLALIDGWHDEVVITSDGQEGNLEIVDDYRE